MSIGAETAFDTAYRSPAWSSSGTELDENRIVIPSHLVEMVIQLRRLLHLQPNWNSYGARTVDPKAVIGAIELLTTAGWTGVLPAVSPLASGGVQLEWGDQHDGVELDVFPDGSVSILVDVGGSISERRVARIDDPALWDALTWATKLSH